MTQARTSDEDLVRSGGNFATACSEPGSGADSTGRSCGAYQPKTTVLGLKAPRPEFCIGETHVRQRTNIRGRQKHEDAYHGHIEDAFTDGRGNNSVCESLETFDAHYVLGQIVVVCLHALERKHRTLELVLNQRVALCRASDTINSKAQADTDNERQNRRGIDVPRRINHPSSYYS